MSSASSNWDGPAAAKWMTSFLPRNKHKVKCRELGRELFFETALRNQSHLNLIVM